MKITLRMDLTSAETRVLESERGAPMFDKMKQNLTIDTERLRAESGGARASEIIGAEIYNEHGQMIWIML